GRRFIDRGGGSLGSYDPEKGISRGDMKHEQGVKERLPHLAIASTTVISGIAGLSGASYSSIDSVSVSSNSLAALVSSVDERVVSPLDPARVIPGLTPDLDVIGPGAGGAGGVVKGQGKGTGIRRRAAPRSSAPTRVFRARRH